MAKKPKDDAVARAEAGRKALYERTDEAQRVMDEARPTPSQAEVDMAVTNIAAGRGATVEPDPAGEEEKDGAPQNRTMAAKTDAAYSTRQVGAGKDNKA